MKALRLDPNSALGGVSRAIDRTSRAVGVLTAVLFIGGAGLLYFGGLTSDLAREAGVLRVVTEKFVAERPDSWKSGSERLNTGLSAYASKGMSYRIETLAGEVVAANENASGGNRVTRREKIFLAGEHVGNVEVGIPVFGPTLFAPALAVAAILLLAFGLAMLIGQLLRLRPLAALREADFSMQQAQNRLRQLNDRLESVREEERTRIAREIHDEIGQQITAIKIATVALLQATGSTSDRKHLVSMFDQAMKTVRNIAWELRPSILDTLGLAAAVQVLGEDFQRRTATRCRVSVPQDALAVDAREATQLYRICQELLTNATRHAVASRVDVTLAAGPPVMLEVADNGVGIPAGALEGTSLGLLGIQERVRRMGAYLRIETVPQFEGTRIRVVLAGPGKPAEEAVR